MTFDSHVCALHPAVTSETACSQLKTCFQFRRCSILTKKVTEPDPSAGQCVLRAEALTENAMNTELRFCRSRFSPCPRTQPAAPPPKRGAHVYFRTPALSDILFCALRAVLQRAERGETVTGAAVTSLFDTRDGARIAGCTGLFSRRDSRLWLHQQISSVKTTPCPCRSALE